MENNHLLASKKHLLVNIRDFYARHNRNVFTEKVFPFTLHVNRKNQHQQIRALMDYIADNPDAIWILKPGENSNQGHGISIENNLEQIKKKIKDSMALAEKKAIQ